MKPYTHQELPLLNEVGKKSIYVFDNYKRKRTHLPHVVHKECQLNEKCHHSISIPYQCSEKEIICQLLYFQHPVNDKQLTKCVSFGFGVKIDTFYKFYKVHLKFLFGHPCKGPIATTKLWGNDTFMIPFRMVVDVKYENPLKYEIDDPTSIKHGSRL